jgi:6-pyruvoyltetrahydropterin/6-carboxytetrahydropterin synthase
VNRITRRFEIDAGHRLQKHETKCRNLHGHRYVFEVTVEAMSLDEVGRVIDFGVLKHTLGGWLNDVLDHGFIIEQGDPLEDWLRVHGQKHYVMADPPSIENLVRLVFEQASELMRSSGIQVAHVRGYETPACWADYGG